MPKSRAERARGRGKTPTKRAQRGAQKVARQDPETGVTSRARSRVERRFPIPTAAARDKKTPVASAGGNDESKAEESRAQEKELRGG